MIAALYVAKGGCYFGLPDVDPWDAERDARLYAGPWPVVAHPPCERWGRSAHGGATAPGRFTIGDDGGCFAAALAAVRAYGGVLEHPADSRAWAHFALRDPPKSGGWVPAAWAQHAVDPYRWDPSGWTCHVEQGWYGHRAKKATWLYAVGCELPSLRWGKDREQRFSPSWTTRLAEEVTPEKLRRAVKTGVLQSLSRNQRMRTPLPFRDLLLGMARSVRRATEAA